LAQDLATGFVKKRSPKECFLRTHPLGGAGIEANGTQKRNRDYGTRAQLSEMRQEMGSPNTRAGSSNDFRRSAAHEMWRHGLLSIVMEVTGHATAAMFKRYADLFSEDERRTTQRKVQERRRFGVMNKSLPRWCLEGR